MAKGKLQLLLLLMLFAVSFLLFLPSQAQAAACASEIDACCDITGAGVYTLNTSFASGGTDPCFTISASDVILDGAGYTVTSNFACTWDGILANGLTNVTVTNIKLDGFDSGIWFVNVNDSAVTYSDIGLSTLTPGVGGAVRLQYSNNNNISHNFLYSNSFNPAIIIQDSSSNSIVDSNEIVDGYYGMMVSGSLSVNVTNNFIHNSWGSGALSIDTSDNILVQNNTIYNNTQGGMNINSLNNAQVIENNASSNAQSGISLAEVYNSNISNNLISDNIVNAIGLNIGDIINCTFTNNIMTNNKRNFVFGNPTYDPAKFNNSIDTSNTANGKPILYLQWINDTVYDSSTSASTIYCIWCDNVTIKDLDLSNNGIGVGFYFTNNSQLENLTVDNDQRGIDLESSEYNNLTNIANSYSNEGIVLFFSSNNNIINATTNGSNGGYQVIASNNNVFTNGATLNTSNFGVNFGGSSLNNIVYNHTFSSYPTTVNFTYSGDVLLKGVSSPPADPSGKANIGKYIELFNSTDNAWLFLNISYNDPADLGAILGEGTLNMSEYSTNTSTWSVDPSTFTSEYGLDTVNDYVYANITTMTVGYYQNSIVAPLGDPNPYSITTCGVSLDIAGYYTLDASVLGSSDMYCINITSSDVILDGLGNTISGTDTPMSYGIYVLGAGALTNVTIENLNTADWFWGIWYESADSGIIQNNSITSSEEGMHFVTSTSSNNITQNNASFNTAGLMIDAGTNNIIFNNTFDNNVAMGMMIGASGNNVTNNQFVLNGDRGTDIMGSSNNFISNNFSSNAVYGMHFNGGDDNNIIDCTADNNGYDVAGEGDAINNIGTNFTSNSVVVNFNGKDFTLKGMIIPPPGGYPGSYLGIDRNVDSINNSEDSWLFLNISYAGVPLGGISESTFFIGRHNGTWETDPNVFTDGNYGVNTVDDYVYANITGFGSTFAPLGGTNTEPQVDLNLPANDTQINNTQNIYFNFTTTDDLSATLSCDIYLDDVLNQTNSSTLNGTLTNFLINGISLGSYNWSVNCTDGSLDNVSETRFFTTADTALPQITSVSATNITTNSATISWLTDEAANSTVDYGLNVSLVSSETNATLDTNHNVTLTSLNAGTLYYYNVTSCDAVGNCNTTGPSNFTTTSAAVVPPPPSQGAPGGTTSVSETLGGIIAGTSHDVTLSFGGIATFTSNGEAHSVRISGIFDSTVEITISSNPIKATFKLGETKQFDTNSNGLNDLEITLLSKTNTTANLRIKVLSEIPTPTPAPAPAAAAAACGNGICESGETLSSCPIDCAGQIATSTAMFFAQQGSVKTLALVLILMALAYVFWARKHKKPSKNR